MNPQNWHSVRRIADRPLALSVLAGLSCFGGCTLQDFEHLNNGPTRAAGGTKHSGGSVAATSPGVSNAGSSATGGTAGGANIVALGGDAPVVAGGASPSAVGGSATIGSGGLSAIAGSGTGGEVACDAGLSSCPGEPACTTSLANGKPSGVTVNHCGNCGLTCSLTNAMSSTCANAKCVSVCNTGFADCNLGALNDGCEIDLMVVASACGQCGRTCSTYGVASPRCSAGVCAPTCSPKYADCNPDAAAGPDDGCEVYLDALTRCGTSCTNGVACAANQVCNDGTCGAAQGVVALTVPLTAVGQNQRYADKFPALPNLADTSLTLRVYAPGATGGMFAVYITDQKFNFSGYLYFSLTSLSSGWTDVVVPVGSAVGAYDPSHVYQVTLEVQSGSAGPWANPTVVYIDSIRASNGAVNDTFDTATNNMVGSSLQVVDGATLTWQSGIP